MGPEREAGSGQSPDVTADLVARARSGAPEAFGEAWARVAPAVCAWAGLRLGPALRRRLEPEDVIQEVCCRAWAAFAAFDPARAAFRSWVFGIAKNVLKEGLLNLRRTAGLSGSARAAALDGAPADATSVSRRVARDEALRAFVLDVERLDQEERRLLLFRGLEGLSHPEVGERLGLSAEAAAKRWQRLREKLSSTESGTVLPLLMTRKHAIRGSGD